MLRGKVPLSDEVALEDEVRNSGRGSGDTNNKADDKQGDSNNVAGG